MFQCSYLKLTIMFKDYLILSTYSRVMFWQRELWYFICVGLHYSLDIQTHFVDIKYLVCFPFRDQERKGKLEPPVAFNFLLLLFRQPNTFCLKEVFGVFSLRRARERERELEPPVALNRCFPLDEAKILSWKHFKQRTKKNNSNLQRCL